MKQWLSQADHSSSLPRNTYLRALRSPAHTSGREKLQTSIYQSLLSCSTSLPRGSSRIWEALALVSQALSYLVLSRLHSRQTVVCIQSPSCQGKSVWSISSQVSGFAHERTTSVFTAFCSDSRQLTSPLTMIVMIVKLTPSMANQLKVASPASVAVVPSLDYPLGRLQSRRATRSPRDDCWISCTAGASSSRWSAALDRKRRSALVDSADTSGESWTSLGLSSQRSCNVVDTLRSPGEGTQAYQGNYHCILL